MAGSTARSHNMLSGSLVKSALFYSVPIMLTSILQLLFNTADLIVVGRYCGELSVAAVGNTTAIIGLIVNLFVGLSVGTGVIVAQGLGAKDDAAVHRAVHTALPLALVCGAAITVLGLIFADPLLRLIDTPDSVFPLSSTYLKIYFLGTLFMMVYNFCAAILRAAGDTKSPLIYLTIAGVVNVILNLVCVIGLGMNVEGVAWPTAISQVVAAVLTVIALMRRPDACRLIWRKIRFYKAELARSIRIGLPAGIQSSLFAISNLIIQSSFNSFGDIFMSGNSAAHSIESFMYTALNSFSQASLNFTGQNVGAGQYKRVKKVLWVCLGYVAAFCVVLSTVILIFGRQLLGIYLPNSPEAVEWGMLRLICMSYPFMFGGWMDVTTGSLRGMGASTVPMITSVLGICGLRILWVATLFRLPAFHSPLWLYISYDVSWAVTFAVQMISFVVLYRRRTRGHPELLK